MYFTTRSESKARKTKEFLLAERPEVDQKNIQWLAMDLLDLKSINAAALELNKKESKVDILSMLKTLFLASR